MKDRTAALNVGTRSAISIVAGLGILLPLALVMPLIEIPTAFLGILGWDAGVHARWRLHGSGVALYGGGPWLLPWVCGMLLLASVAIAASSPFTRSRSATVHLVQLAAWAMPMGLALTAVLAVMLHTTSLWDGNFVVRTGLVHRGERMDEANGFVPWLMLGAVYACAWAAMCFYPRRRLHWSRAVAFCSWSVILTLWPALILPLSPDRFSGLHTGKMLLALSAVWSSLALGVLLLVPPRGVRRIWAGPRRIAYGIACLGCRYDLRGTVAAGRDACPECGRLVPPAQSRAIRDIAAGIAGGTRAL